MPDLRDGSAIRRWFVAAVLLLLPSALYHDAIAAHYGFRDDYSILRESRDEPGKVLGWCASQGRPLYGAVLEATFARLDGVGGLGSARSLSGLAVGLVSVLAFAALRRARWNEGQSCALAALLAVLPAAQIDVSWAVCFPHVLGAVAGLGGFLLAESGGLRQRAGGAALVAAGALFYQPHALLYVMPVAAGLVARRHDPIAARARWVGPHLLTLAAGLGLAFAVVNGLFAAGIAEPSQLWAFDPTPLAKLRWFASGPLRDALAMIVLRDEARGPGPQYWAMAAGVAGAIAIAVLGELRRNGSRAAGFFVLSAAGLVLASFAANLIAAERTPKYRTIWALTAVLAVLAVQGLETLSEWLPRSRGRLGVAVLALLALVGAPRARSQAYDLIALPQREELALVEQSVRSPLLRGEPAVFVIHPPPENTAAPLRFEDEFGSLSSASDWVPVEMFKAAIEERDPSLCDAPRSCRIATGLSEPAGGHYDLVIDMRRLRALHGDTDAAPRNG